MSSFVVAVCVLKMRDVARASKIRKRSRVGEIVYLAAEEGEKGLVEEGGLDAAHVAGLVVSAEVDAGQGGRLDVAAQLGGGLGLTSLVLGELESGLQQ